MRKGKKIDVRRATAFPDDLQIDPEVESQPVLGLQVQKKSVRVAIVCELASKRAHSTLRKEVPP